MLVDDNLLFTANKINSAHKPEDIFGLIAAPNIAEKLMAFNKLWKGLIKIVAPDHYINPEEIKIANEAFKRLMELKTEGQKKIEENTYGKEKAPVVITSLGKTYTIRDKFKSGSIANIYMSGDKILKMCKVPQDNDLLETEKEALTTVRAFMLKHLNGSTWITVIPEIISSFQLPIEGFKHRVNVMNFFPDMMSLKEVKEKMNIDPRTSAWMLKRLFNLLPWINEAGYVHGAILPDHLLVMPDNANNEPRHKMKHAIVLVDWCYAVKQHSKLVSWNPEFIHLYPPEVRNKKPVMAATDIYMAVMSILYLLGGDIINKKFPVGYPKELEVLLLPCLDPNPAKRPTCKEIFPKLKTVLETVFGKPTWHNFNVV